MSVYNWSDGVTSFFYSYDDTEPTPKDQLRGMLGDVDGFPVSYKSDDAIGALYTRCGGDLDETAAQYAESCASRVLQISELVRQGHRLEIKNFDPDKAYQHFMELAQMFRNKNRPSGVNSPAAASGKMRPQHGTPIGCGSRAWWPGR